MSEHVMNILSQISNGLTGRAISDDEKMMLIKKFSGDLISLGLIDISSNYKTKKLFSLRQGSFAGGKTYVPMGAR